MANWFIAARHSLAARPQSAVMLRSASQIRLLAASSLGKWPRVLMILRSRAWMRKLPRQVDKPEVETSALNTLGLNAVGGRSPRDSWGRYSL